MRVAGEGVVALETSGGEVTSSAVVISAGIASRALLKPLGIRLPLYPLKGYSLTYDAVEALGAPKASVTDFHHKVVCARLGTRLRIAGLADMDGCNRAIRPARIKLLKAQAQALVPGITRHDSAHEWTGLRPATPDGIPLTGKTKIKGLWLNTGHGALGFTLAPASAVELAEKMLSEESIGSDSIDYD
jgi:D-amino-acid dehydrogenase